MYDIPILFIIFRRKDVALQSFERIRRVQPSKLYIACDGARANVKGEKELVESTRKAIIDSIDWDCEVYTKFQTENLGCGIGVYTAINWFFNNEEEGIILEEDCVANSSFFIYVKELLERYGNDERIGMIAGTNPIKNIYMHDSYCFSKYAACWGWATWRRSWKNMKLNLDFLNEHKKDVLLNRGFIGKDVSRWAYQLKLINNNRVSAWDWQWYFSLAAQNQLCIFPKSNLISNIGNDSDATHTAFSNIFIADHELDFPLQHPNYILPYSFFDKELFKKGNCIKEIIKRKVPYSIKLYIKNFIR